VVPVATAEATHAWSALDAHQKRARLLEVANEVFTEDGLDATMPLIADAAGIGIGSLYRCYGSKDELIAALVLERLDGIRAEIAAAHEHDDASEALETTIRRMAERQAADKLIRTALAATSDRREVQLALGEVSLAWQGLLDRARAQGRLRSDATVTDLRLIFAATQAADEVEPGARARMLDLLLEAMNSSASPDG
jgi:AcrR family transcriptional regulator